MFIDFLRKQDMNIVCAFIAWVNNHVMYLPDVIKQVNKHSHMEITKKKHGGIG